VCFSFDVCVRLLIGIQVLYLIGMMSSRRPHVYTYRYMYVESRSDVCLLVALLGNAYS
jgi:hypothetical protein